jgi:N-methylhydantoinase A
VEWVNLRVTGVGPIRRPRLRELPPGPAGPGGRTYVGSRPVCFEAAAGFAPAALRERSHLAPGDVVRGPAIIEEYGSTVPVHPGFAATVDRYGNLVVTRDS